jgi:hypothetical protein
MHLLLFLEHTFLCCVGAVACLSTLDPHPTAAAHSMQTGIALALCTCDTVYVSVCSVFALLHSTL